MAKDITVVTGFWDIGRGNWHPTDIQCSRRTNEQYFDYFDTLAELKNPMAIAVSAAHADRVYDSRKKHGLASDDMTRIMIKDLPAEFRARAHRVVANPVFRDYVLSKEIPEFKFADYSVVTNLKSQLVVDALDGGFVRTAQAAWIDFGYCRAANWFNAAQPWEYDFGERINMWALRAPDERPIFEIIRTAMIYFMGCHIVGPAALWRPFNTSWQASVNAMLECGFTDDDQTTMLMVWRKNPTMFQLRPGRDCGPNSWYYILRAFNDNHAATPPLMPQAGPGASPTVTFDARMLS